MLFFVTGIVFCVNTFGRGMNLSCSSPETSSPVMICDGTHLSWPMVRSRMRVLLPLMLSCSINPSVQNVAVLPLSRKAYVSMVLSLVLLLILTGTIESLHSSLPAPI